MEYFIAGVQLGFIYALLALGIVLIYRTTRILNFAHADFATFGTFISLSMINTFGSESHISFLISGFLGALISGAIAFLLYITIIYEGQRRDVSPIGLTIITIGFSYFLQTVSIIIWGAEPKSMPYFAEGVVKIGGFSFSGQFILIVFVSLFMMALLYFIVMRTRFGIAMRAVSQNLDMARTLGINIRFVVGITWGLSAFTGGIAGILIAPIFFVDQFFLFDPFLKAFVGTVIGGLDSPPGAIIGSLMVGIAEALFGGYISIKYKSAFIFSIALISLLIRPEGIFGREIKERA